MNRRHHPHFCHPDPQQGTERDEFEISRDECLATLTQIESHICGACYDDSHDARKMYAIRDALRDLCVDAKKLEEGR